MADMTISKPDQSGSGPIQGQESGRSTSVERRVGRNPASLFSLTPRELMSANPFELMRRFTEDMDRFFETGSPGWSGSSAMTMWSPPIEISEQDGQLSVSAELPGLRKEDVKVELTPDGLTISGERKREQEERRVGIYRSERSYGIFARTIPIPEEAQVDHAKATFENGVLKVSIPVPEAQQHRREIPIETGGSDTIEASSGSGKSAGSGTQPGAAKAA
jgi:HSP20 family protein